MELTRRSLIAGTGALIAGGSLGLIALENAGVATAEEAASETDNTVSYDAVDIEEATAEEVEAVLSGSDATTLLVDARPQEAYAGWALEGAANGGHLAGAKLFSARWLDCDYAQEAPRSCYLERAMADQDIASGSNVIVYDYAGSQALEVARYLASQGVSAKRFQANELIDEGSNLESYEHYQRFVPTELVKSVSDVKTGRADALTDEAAAVFGSDVDRILIFDCGWGNARSSSYFMTGHVPGAVHMNTDCYERPRVYVPEKRSNYAKEWRLIGLEEFRNDLCPRYGITKDSVVIVTGAGSAPIARFSWMLRCVGVEVYAMTGLLTAWKYNGYELDTDESTLVIPNTVESFGDEGEIPHADEVLWMDDVLAIYNGEREGQICDNRDADCWNGLYSGYSYHDLAGNIEGSIWTCQGDDKGQYFQCADGTPRTYEEYVTYLENCGCDTTKTMAFFCGDSWGAAMISYWCQSTDLMTAMQWGRGWIPWSNEGHEFIDHNGNKVHYDKWLDTVVDADGNDMRDGVNILDDAQ